MTGKISAQILFINYQLGKLEWMSDGTDPTLCSFLIHPLHPILYFVDNRTNTKDERATIKLALLTSPGSSKKGAKGHKKGKTKPKPKDHIVVATLLQGDVAHFDVLTKDNLTQVFFCENVNESF